MHQISSLKGGGEGGIGGNISAEPRAEDPSPGQQTPPPGPKSHHQGLQPDHLPRPDPPPHSPKHPPTHLQSKISALRSLPAIVERGSASAGKTPNAAECWGGICQTTRKDGSASMKDGRTGRPYLMLADFELRCAIDERENYWVSQRWEKYILYGL